MLDRITPPPVYMMGKLTLPVPDTEVLPNGIVVHRLCGGSQDVNQLSLTWRGGLLEAQNPAVSKIMALLMREGTSTMTGSEISEALDFNGAMLKLMADSHNTVLNLSSLNSKTANVLPIIRDILTDATFPEAAFHTYRDIEVKELLLSKAKVMVQCFETLMPMIKGAHHPDAIVPTVESIQSVTLAEVRDYYRRVINAAGCHAFVSGNITDAIYADVCSMLSAMPAASMPVALDLIPYEAQAPGRVVVDKPDARQAAVTMALPAPSRSHPDYVPLRFTVIALGGYFGSRLMKNIREDKGYTYGIASYLFGAKEGSYIMITAQTDKKYVDLLIDEVRHELHRLATEPLGHDELQRLKQFISSSLMETLDSPFSIMDYYRTIESVGLPQHYFEDQVDWVRRIDADTIMTMARRYIDADHLRIAIVK